MRRPRFSRTIIGFPFFRYWVTIRRLSAHPPLYTERNRIGFRPLLTVGDWQLAACWDTSRPVDPAAAARRQAQIDRLDREAYARNSGGCA